MYRYDSIDRQLLQERVAQYRGQIERNLAGTLSDDELRPLRLQNGLYIQRHGPMLRIAIPYGILAADQLRKLAELSRRYDRSVGHFTTRHNMQFNWPKFEETPNILAELSEVDMHAIQTSGNCIRNITTDKFAGTAPDEDTDPRPVAEILRQWSTFHPEFSFLPRKFKIAVSGSAEDRSVLRVHDVGIELINNADGAPGARIFVGGGLGRTPLIGQVVREFLPRQHLLTYLEAILRVYNRYGRRDNLFKARIKILVNALGIADFSEQVEAEWEHLKDGPATLTDTEFERIAAHFAPPAYAALSEDPPEYAGARASTPAFAAWARRSVHPAPRPRLCRRHAFAQGIGQGAGRHHRHPDGRRRRARRPFQLRRTARRARTESGAPQRAPGRPARTLGGSSRTRIGHRQHRPADRHDLLPPAAISARSPMPARCRSHSPCMKPSTTSTTCTISANCRSTSPAA